MEHGKVTSVEYRDGVVYCSVRPMRTTSEYTALPVLKPHSGFIQVPQLGQQVMMDKLDDGTRFISNVMADEEHSPEEVSEGDLAIQLDKKTTLSFQKQSNGDYDISIEASGEIVVDSDSVKLGGSSDTKVVARKGDSVETTDPLTGSDTGEITSGASNTEAK